MTSGCVCGGAQVAADPSSWMWQLKPHTGEPIEYTSYDEAFADWTRLGGRIGAVRKDSEEK